MSLIIPAAQAAERRHGIPAAITIGQAGLESGWGKHMPPGSNNPFGIKAKGNEPFVLARTREERADGSSYYTMAKFRKFGSYGEAVEAHAQLLMGKRYRSAREAGSVDGFADALTGTYATDHKYGAKLKGAMHGGNPGHHDYAAAEVPVRVEVHLVNATPGTRTKVTAGRKSPPAVSHAMAN